MFEKQPNTITANVSRLRLAFKGRCIEYVLVSKEITSENETSITETLTFKVKGVLYYCVSSRLKSAQYFNGKSKVELTRKNKA